MPAAYPYPVTYYETVCSLLKALGHDIRPDYGSVIQDAENGRTTLQSAAAFIEIWHKTDHYRCDNCYSTFSGMVDSCGMCGCTSITDTLNLD